MLSIVRFPVLVALTAVLFGGPVAACFCMEDTSMAAMPCCPDQPPASDHGDPGMPPEIAIACSPMSGAGLLTSALELPTPDAVEIVSLPNGHGFDPPASLATPTVPTYDGGSPVYLTTLRLRI